MTDWVIERYERTGWEREDGRKQYRGHFWESPWPKTTGIIVGVEFNFWAKHPVLAMREIAESGLYLGEFQHKTIN